MPGYRNCRTARHICYVNWTAFECVWSSNRKRFCKIRFSSWTWTLHILSTPFRCSALSDRLIRVLMRGELTLFVSCVEICGFVCSVIRKMCDLRLIPAWWAVLSLSFEENSKIRLCYGALCPRADIALAWLVDFNLHSRASEYNWSQLITTDLATARRGKWGRAYEDSDVYPASKLLKTSFRKTNNYPNGLWRAHQKFRLGISAWKIGVREVPVRRADGR